MRKTVELSLYGDVIYLHAVPGTGRLLDSGSGCAAVYEFGKRHIIKYGFLDRDDVKRLFQKLRYLKRTKPKHVMRIEQFGQILHPFYTNTVCYYYVAERLYPLKKDDRKYIQYFQGEPTVIDPAKVRPSIIDAVRYAYRARYKDLHDNNVMQNKRGTCKLIDIEGFVAV